MAGTINSLGIGSGVLTADIIEKLKANDEALTLNPIKSKIELNAQKSDALDLLASLVSSFKSSASALADDTIFANRTVSGNSDGITVTADAGVAVQSFSISDTSLAKQNVLEAAGFSASDETIATGSGTLNINIGDTDYQIAYDNSTTLEGLRDAINTQAGDAVRASILQTDNEAYSLVLTSQETGLEQSIVLSDFDGNLKADSSLTSSGFTSGTFSSSSAKIASSGGSGTLDLSIGGTTYQFDYGDTTTLSEMADLINSDDTLGGKVHAAVIQYGEDDYRLSLTSNSELASEAIVLTENGSGLNDALKSDALISSASFSSADDAIAIDGSGSFRVSIDSVDYDFAYDDTTTLQELADAINADTTLDDKLNASIVQYGENDYRLVLSNLADTQDSTITTSDVGATGSGLVANLVGGTYVDGSADLNESTLSVVQDAKDATFKFNGITVTRSSNEISDIITGVTINLIQEDESSNFSITQDSGAVSDELSSFATAYNTLISQLNSMTTSDIDAGTIGVFNGDNSINAIRREINKYISYINTDGLSIAQYGISLNQDGTMSYKEIDFYEKFNEDPDAAEKFFSGESIVDDNDNYTYVNGVFDDLNELLNGYTKSGGYLANLSDGFSAEADSLEENYDRSAALLEARYNAMTAQFIEYDSIISKLNNQFSVLQSMIDAELKN